MQKFLVVLQYACIAFGLYLIYSVGMSLYTQQFELMELVADIGTILICIDLGVFLYTSKGKSGISMEEYAKRLEQPPSKLVYVTRTWRRNMARIRANNSFGLNGFGR